MMSLYERILALYERRGDGFSFEGYVEDYMARNFGIFAEHEEMIGNDEDDEIYHANVEWSYKLDIDNKRIEIFIEGEIV